MSSGIFEIFLSGVAGILLGGFFFSGLWWTVRKGVTSKHPAFLFISSLLVRAGVVLIGFYFISGGQWERLFAALAGFIVARIIVSRITKKRE